MKTGNNKATNNFIIRIWSRKYYGEKALLFEGTITDVKTKKAKHFHNSTELLEKLSLMNYQAEQRRLK